MKIKIVTFLLLSTLFAFSQTEDNSKKCPLSHAFGFNLGRTTGIGLSYQAYYKNSYGFQLSAAPYIASENDQRLNFGFAGLYKLRDRDRVDFLSYVGVNYIYTRFENTSNYVFDPINQTYNYTQSIVTNNQINLGLGLGFEYNTKKDITLSLLGGYGGFSTNNKWSVLPTIEASIFYKL